MSFVADIFGKSAPTPPPAPDYNAIAQTQGAANVETAKTQAKLNNANIINPYGSQTVSWGKPTVDQAGFDKAMEAYNAAPGTQVFNQAAYDDAWAKASAPQAVTEDNFDAAAYLKQNKDVAASIYASNPLQHYKDWGFREGRLQAGNSAPLDYAPFYTTTGNAKPTIEQFTTKADENTPTITQSLSPTQQRLFDQQNQIATQLGTAATEGLSRATGAMSTPFDMSRVTAKGILPSVSGREQSVAPQSGWQQGSYQRGAPNPAIGAQLDSDIAYWTSGEGASHPKAASRIAEITAQKQNWQNGSGIGAQGGGGQQGMSQGQGSSQGVEPQGWAQGPGVSSQTSAAQYGAMPGTSNFQSAPGASNFQNMTGTAQYGAAPGTSNFQNYNVQSQYGSAPSASNLQNYDERSQYNQGIPQADSASADRVAQAMYQRAAIPLAYQNLLQNNSAMTGGHNLGGRAMNAIADNQNRGWNDLALGSILAGGQEQSRLFGLQMQQAQLGDTRANALRDQGLQNAGFNNANAQTRFGQDMALAGLGDTRANALQAQGLQNAGFNNANAQARFGQDMALAGLGDTRANTVRDQGMQNAQFNNANAQTLYNQQMQNAQLGDTRANNQYAQTLGNTTFNNANAARTFDQQMAGVNLNNANAQTLYNQQIQNAQMGDTRANNQFTQTEAAKQALFNQQLAAGQFQDSQKINQFNQEAQLFGMQGNQRQQDIQEQAYLRSLPLSELNSLRTGSQPTMPQFQAYTGGGNIAPPPIMQGSQLNYQAALGPYNAQLAQNNAITEGLFSLGSAAIPMMSDRRLKSNIVRIGTHPLGIGIYEYDIFGEHDQGVMADEVLRVMPAAVVHTASGYMAVNYAMLGA